MLGGVEEGAEGVRPVCAGRGRGLISVREVGENGTNLMRHWEVDYYPAVAPGGKVCDADGDRPSGGSNPLSVGGGGAPCTVLDAHPPLKSDGWGGSRGGDEDPEEPPLLRGCPA